MKFQKNIAEKYKKLLNHTNFIAKINKRHGKMSGAIFS